MSTKLIKVRIAGPTTKTWPGHSDITEKLYKSRGIIEVEPHIDGTEEKYVVRKDPTGSITSFWIYKCDTKPVNKPIVIVTE